MIIIAAILTSLILAPLGCFVLWKRYVYFSDALAHASIIASVVTIIFNIHIFYTAIICSIIFVTSVTKLRKGSSNNASIGLTSSFMVATAIILSKFFSQIDAMNLLFGRIKNVNNVDLVTLFMLMLLTWSFLIINYKKLLLIIVNEDIATLKGVNVEVMEFLFLLILSASVLLTIKIVGVLLVNSILIIPAIIARKVAINAFSMLIFASIIGQIMNLITFASFEHLGGSFAPVLILSGVLIYSLILIYSVIFTKRV